MQLQAILQSNEIMRDFYKDGTRGFKEKGAIEEAVVPYKSVLT